jgi:hypothetical protein
LVQWATGDLPPRARHEPVLCALGDLDDVLGAPEELMIRRKVLEPVAWQICWEGNGRIWKGVIHMLYTLSTAVTTCGHCRRYGPMTKGSKELCSIYLSIYLFVCLSVYLSVYLSVCLSICLSICITIWLHNNISI